MNWGIIVKRSAPQEGMYGEWKEQLAEEGAGRCVYCALSDAAFGGMRNFHVEHFRPKSLFPLRTNDYSNLYYACAICNTFKGDDWREHSPLTVNLPCYPEPSKLDYGVLFLVLPNKATIEGQSTAGRYVVERLYLNRPQLIVARRIAAARAFALSELALARELLLSDQLNREELKRISILLLDLGMLLDRGRDLSPYALADVSRE